MAKGQKMISRKRVGKSRYAKKPRTRVRAYHGSLTSRKVELQYQIYSIASADPLDGRYSFTGAGIVSQSRNITFGLLADPEHLQMSQEYAYFKVSGINLSYNTSLNSNSNQMLLTPDLCIDIVPEIEGQYNDTTFRADGALRAHPASTDNFNKYMVLPSVNLIGDNSIKSLGNDWFTCTYYSNNWSQRYPLALILGSPSSTANSAGNTSVIVGVLTVTLYIKYAKRIRIK